MSFDAHEDKIRELFNRKVYNIPRNQRRYVWKKSNWQELFDGVLSVVEGKLTSHFIGSIVLKEDDMENGLPNYLIIDGQQRIITLSIFLSCIMYWLKREGMKSDFNGTKPYVIAKDDKDNDVVMVTTDDGASLESIVKTISEMDDTNFEKITPTSMIKSNIYSKSDENIGEAFKFYLQTISDYYKQVGAENLLKLRDAVRDITFVNITATTEEDSYTIFEILNARGQDLADHELLKNYIMRYIQPEKKRDKAKLEWHSIESTIGNKNMVEFIRHYTIHKYGDSGRNNKSEYKTIQDNNRGKSTQELLKDIQKKSLYYSVLLSPAGEIDDHNRNETEYRVFEFFRKKRQKQMRPVLLSLITRNKSGEISDELYNKTLNFLYNFYVCYNIIGAENSNRLTNTLNKYAVKIENEYNENIVAEFVSELKKKLPTEEMFKNAFCNVGWSKRSNIYEGEKNKDRVQTVLEVLERYYNNGFCNTELTIEHILPDSQSDENGQIGNLIPLESKLNEKCEDKELKDKIPFYSKSSFISARNFSNRYKDEVFVPSKRTEYMARLFYKDILKL